MGPVASGSFTISHRLYSVPDDLLNDLVARVSFLSGPPKGYIDALESKLHQTEALLGTIVASPDPRARSLIASLSQDRLAAEIIRRVDDSQYGNRARKQAAASKQLYGDSPAASTSSKRRESAAKAPPEVTRHGFTAPPHEWQDSLDALISRNSTAPPSKFDSPALSQAEDIKPTIPKYANDPVNPHQRRRLDTESPPVHLSDSLPPDDNASKPHSRIASAARSRAASHHSTSPPDARAPSSSLDHEEHDDGNESDLADALGQLSVNDVKQVRYHGKASGLQFLTPAMTSSEGQENVAGPSRFKEGLWAFPPAGVWPPPPPQEKLSSLTTDIDNDMRVDAAASKDLPSVEKQQHLLHLYFIYVHPILPIVHKPTFLRDFAIRQVTLCQTLARLSDRNFQE